MMDDGSPATLRRNQAADGGTWTYQRSVRDNTGPEQTQTTIIDPTPQANVSDFWFSGNYLTARSIYSGARNSFLDYSYICYNGNSNTGSCKTAVISTTNYINERKVYEFPNYSTKYSMHDFAYDQYGNLTGQTDWDYASSGNAKLRSIAVITTGESSSPYNSLCTGLTICDRTTSVQIMDGNNNAKAYTTFAYDEDGHTHGNVTSINSSTGGTSGGPFLTRHYGYGGNGATNGVVATSTDSNQTVTNYVYDSQVCNGALPTSSYVPGDAGSNLTTTYSYDAGCHGAVETAITDPNGQSEHIAYTDSHYWRPSSVVDQANKTTSYSYPQPGQVESVMLFNNGSSTFDFVSTADVYGRAWLRQKRQGPAWTTFDTVATDYDLAGRPLSTSEPATCTLANDCTAYKTTTTYDGAGRPNIITSPDGGNVSYTYVQNDVFVTVGPAPSGENAKSRNLEYDGLGRLASVCEVTGAGASGCGGQTSPPAHGAFTSYSYDPLGGLTGVNQGGQLRVYSYDGLGRLTAESNPESATASYYYDSESSTCNSVSAGDLVKRVDALGTTCLYYDGLHRVTAAGNGYEGSNAVCHRYRYDGMTGFKGLPPPGTMSNYNGRLKEAATDNCGDLQNDPVISDEWFNYDSRGSVTDIYESTPHSGGYYHVSSTYWDNGLLQTLSGVPGVPSMTYGPNEGGRPYTVSAASGQNPITAASYNVAGQLLTMNFGSGDTDGFAYDQQTGRFKQYQYNFGATSKTVQGDLSWNPNGTLQALVITDGASSSKNQSCQYTYDDWGRILSVNCKDSSQNNVWNQTFDIDSFGNIRKLVPTGGTGVSFLPTYSSLTNQFTSIPGVTAPYYDNAGNMVKDNAYTYSWDQNWGNVASITSSTSSIGLTADAFWPHGGTDRRRSQYGDTLRP